MLYKFKSKSCGDLIMLEPDGRRVLAIIGKESQAGSGDKGILLPEQMPAAIAALQAAVAAEEADQKAMQSAAPERNQPVPRLEAISLRQRALPFIELLRRCQQAGHEMVWGV